MQQAQQDIDSLNYLKDGEKLKSIVQSEAWVFLKDRLKEKITDLESIHFVTGNTPEERDIDLKARIAATEILKDVVVDVESLVEQFEANKNLASPSYIHRV